MIKIALLITVSVALTILVAAASLWLDNRRLRVKLRACQAREMGNRVAARNSAKRAAESYGEGIRKMRDVLSEARMRLGEFEAAGPAEPDRDAAIARLRLCAILGVESSLRASKRRQAIGAVK